MTHSASSHQPAPRPASPSLSTISRVSSGVGVPHHAHHTLTRTRTVGKLSVASSAMMPAAISQHHPGAPSAAPKAQVIAYLAELVSSGHIKTARENVRYACLNIHAAGIAQTPRGRSRSWKDSVQAARCWSCKSPSAISCISDDHSNHEQRSGSHTPRRCDQCRRHQVVAPRKSSTSPHQEAGY